MSINRHPANTSLASVDFNELESIKLSHSLFLLLKPGVQFVETEIEAELPQSSFGGLVQWTARPRITIRTHR